MLPASKKARTSEGAQGETPQSQDAVASSAERAEDAASDGAGSDVEEEDREDSSSGSDQDSDDSDAEEMVLDEFGRVPGGIPGQPCFPDLNYDLRSYPAFLDWGKEDNDIAIADCRADGSIALAGYGDVPSRDIAPPRRARP